MSEIKYVTPSGLTHYDEKIKEVIDDKVDKIDGKGLSANDLTNELKTEYDDTVAKAHEHSNIDVLKKFSEDSNGMPLYDNDKFYDGFVANDLTTTDEGYALDARQGKVLGDRVSELETPTFTQATTRANIASGESTKTILGKIKKYFTDLKTHAFNVPANNLTTTTTGYALDATQGKALQDKLGSTDISAIGDGTVTNAISTINSNLKEIKTISECYVTDKHSIWQAIYDKAISNDNTIINMWLKCDNATNIFGFEGRFLLNALNFQGNICGTIIYHWNIEYAWVFSANTYETDVISIRNI